MATFNNYISISCIITTNINNNNKFNINLIIINKRNIITNKIQNINKNITNIISYKRLIFNNFRFIIIFNYKSNTNFIIRIILYFISIFNITKIIKFTYKKIITNISKIIINIITKITINYNTKNRTTRSICSRLPYTYIILLYYYNLIK